MHLRPNCLMRIHVQIWFTRSMVLRKKGQSGILMKSQTVCRHSNSLGKKGQYARTYCINFFNKTYQNNLCSLALQIGLFLPNEFECIQTVWLFIKMSDWPFLRNTIVFHCTFIPFSFVAVSFLNTFLSLPMRHSPSLYLRIYMFCRMLK